MQNIQNFGNLEKPDHNKTSNARPKTTTSRALLSAQNQFLRNPKGPNSGRLGTSWAILKGSFEEIMLQQTFL